MGLRFDEQKATQVAGRILELRGGRMHYFKLIKLLYLADRDALLQWGRPITTDTFASMKHGPIVSTIYDLIKKKDIHKPIWSAFISDPVGDKEVELLKPTPTNRLSRAEERLLGEIFEKYGRWNRYDLRDFVLHKLPEWKDPGTTSVPITIADILQAEGESNEEIKAIEEELDAVGAEEERLRQIA